VWPGLGTAGCGERSPYGAAALAVGRVGHGLPWEGAVTSSRARRREECPCWVRGAGDIDRLFAIALTPVFSSSPRKMFSSVAHLARANPFNAPQLQLVYDGPRSGPAGPPGPPRRSRNLAAAAVEGESRPSPDAGRPARQAWRTGKGAPGCLSRDVSPCRPGPVSDPWPLLKGVERPRPSVTP
jgi:hypothetical protein